MFLMNCPGQCDFAAPLLKDTFVSGPANTLLSSEVCKIRDVTPGSPNGTINVSSGFPTPEGAVPRTGAVKLWVVPVSTTDYPASTRVVSDVDQALVQTAKFFENQSYGQAMLKHHIEPQNHWVKFPGTAKEYGFGSSTFQQDFSPVMEKILSQWVPSGVVSENDLFLAILPPVPGVKVAMATRRFDQQRFNNILVQNAVLISSTPIESGSWGIQAHELGHSWLRLEDLYHFPNFGPAQDYMGSWDIMSNAVAKVPRFSAWTRWRAGWISDAEVLCVDRSKTSRHFVGEMDTTKGKPKLIVVPLNDHSAVVIDARYDAELRSAIGLSYRIDTSFESGNGPYRVQSAFVTSQTAVIGDVTLTLVDRDSSGVVIEVGPTP